MTDLPEELADADPDEVLAFVRSAGDDELRDAVHRIGTSVALDLIFTAMADRFGPDPGRAPGRLLFALDDDGAEHLRLLELDAGGAVLIAAGPRPRATLKTTLLRFLRVAAGVADPKWLFLTGRLRLTSDPVWAATTLAGLSAT